MTGARQGSVRNGRYGSRIFMCLLASTLALLTMTAPAMANVALAPAPAPTITGLSPTMGAVGGGTVVTVTGIGLTGATKVSFGGTNGKSLTVVSSTQLRITSPARTAGVVDVRVTTPGGTSAIVAADRFTYVSAPAVTGLSPSAGPLAGGTVVTVTGTDFTGATSVSFGGTNGTALTVVSGTQLRVTAPARAAGVVDVKVSAPAGTSAVVAADKYTYTTAPTVTGLSPSSGPGAGGTVVTITGTALTGASTVSFGGTNATAVTVVSATQIRATSPAHASGVADVRVTTPGGTSAIVAADRFTYVSAPAVTGLSPSAGPLAGGTVVTVTGTDFTGATSVSFGGTNGTALTVVSGTQLRITAPARAAGTVDVRVTTAIGISPVTAADQYTYTAAPTISAVTPNSGPVAGGTVVTITGSDLSPASSVTFGGTAGTGLSVISATQIAVTSPAHAAGSVDIVVTTVGGVSVPNSAATFIYAPVPTITGITPNTGLTTGGTTITVTGTGLSAATSVSFDGTPGTALTVLSPTQITVTAPPHAPGTVHVTVSTPGGTSATTAADQFSYTSTSSECGNLTTSTTWTPATVHILTCMVLIPDGVTLTIASGTVIKSDLNGIGVQVSGGTLLVQGTAGAPVVFTVLADDSVGGDTNGDGNASSPTRSGMRVINVLSGSTATLDHVVIRYAASGLSDYCYCAGSNSGTVSLTNSSVSYSGTAIELSRRTLSSLTITGSSFTGNDYGIFTDATTNTINTSTITGTSLGFALFLSGVADVSGVALSGPAANTFTGTSAQRRVVFYESTLPTGKSMTISSDSGAIFTLRGTSNQALLIQGTLTIAAGTIIKNEYHGTGLQVSGGTLLVQGTAEAPVVFTVLADDSVGGDTNGDGSASAPTRGSLKVINIPATAGTVTADHMQIRYADTGLSDFSYGAGTSNATITITNSSINDSRIAVELSRRTLSSLTITGSSFTGNDYGIFTDATTNTINTSTITGTRLGYALFLSGVADVSGVALSGPAANTFTGSSAQRRVVFYESTLPTGKSMTISSDSGAIFSLNGTWNQALLIQGTLTVAAGTVVKNEYHGTGLQVSGGTLLVQGTAGAPVVFTVLADDSVGGDTNGDGNATTPTRGSLKVINIPATAGTVTADHMQIRYADTGLSDFSYGAGTSNATITITNSSINDSRAAIELSRRTLSSLTITGSTFTGNDYGIFTDATTNTINTINTSNITGTGQGTGLGVNAYGTNGAGLVSETTISGFNTGLIVLTGKISFRGVLQNNTRGISACNWDTTCFVDAAHVDWGPQGPLPAGNPKVCGAVTVTPWVGGNNAANLWAVGNCDGSDSAATQLAAAEDNFNRVISLEQIDCSNGFQDVCDQIQRQRACYSAAQTLAWNNVTVAGIPATPPSGGTTTAEVVGGWLSTAEHVVVSSIGSVLQFAGDITGIITLYRDLTHAANSCV